MKILIAYYSRTNNTKKLIQRIQREWEVKGNEVKLERIKLKREPGVLLPFPLDSYLMVMFFVGRLFRKDVIPRFKIKPLSYPDISEFDRICIATPKWGTVPPPTCSYLDTVQGMKNKKVGLVGVYYSPPLQYLELEMLFGQLKRMIQRKEAAVISMIGMSTDFLESSSIKLYLTFGWIFNLIGFGKFFPKEWAKRSPYLISNDFKPMAPYRKEAIKKFCHDLIRSK